MNKLGFFFSLIISISLLVSCGGEGTSNSNKSDENNIESVSDDNSNVSETLAEDIIGIWSFGRKGGWIEIKDNGKFNLGKGSKILEQDKIFELSADGELVINSEKGVKKFRARIEDGILNLRQDGKSKDMKCKRLKSIPK